VCVVCDAMSTCLSIQTKIKIINTSVCACIRGWVPELHGCSRRHGKSLAWCVRYLHTRTACGSWYRCEDVHRLRTREINQNLSRAMYQDQALVIDVCAYDRCATSHAPRAWPSRATRTWPRAWHRYRDLSAWLARRAAGCFAAALP